VNKNLNQSVIFFTVIIIVIVTSSCDILNNEDVGKEDNEAVISLNVGNKYIFQLEQYGQRQDTITYMTDSIISKNRYNGNIYYERSAIGWFRADEEKVYIKCDQNIKSEEYLYLDYSVDVNDTIQYNDNNKYIVEAITYDTLFNDYSEQKIITISNELFNTDVTSEIKYSTKFGVLQSLEINHNWNDTLYKELIEAKIDNQLYGEIK